MACLELVDPLDNEGGFSLPTNAPNDEDMLGWVAPCLVKPLQFSLAAEKFFGGVGEA